MKYHRLTFGCAALVVGCVSSPSPRTQAAAVEAHCDSAVSATDQQVVDPRNMDGVEPLYSFEDLEPTGTTSHLVGAKVHLRHIDAPNPDAVRHALACESARETLSSAPSRSPYSVPDGRVDIQVEPSKGGYDVLLRSSDVHQAREILDRAKAFASK